MNYKVYIFLFILIMSVVACNEATNNPTDQEKNHQPKSVDFEELHLAPLNTEAQEGVRSWKEFQSLMQIVVTMAPTKIKNTEALVTNNPDSLLLYSRLYPVNTKTVLTNILVERDWRTALTANDTVFRIEKTKESPYSYLQWQRFLVAGVPYTFSLKAKKVGGCNRLQLDFLNDKDSELMLTLPIDTLATDNKVQRTELDEEWCDFRVTFTPHNTHSYFIRLGFEEGVQPADNVIFYHSVLEIPARDFGKVSAYSKRIIGEQSDIKSSYYSVFFWLVQIEDALQELLTAPNFPEKLNNAMIKSRFRLLQTEIKLLADNVRNNPDYDEVALKSAIKAIEKTFNELVGRMNSCYKNDLEARMGDIVL